MMPQCDLVCSYPLWPSSPLRQSPWCSHVVFPGPYKIQTAVPPVRSDPTWFLRHGHLAPNVWPINPVRKVPGRLGNSVASNSVTCANEVSQVDDALVPPGLCSQPCHGPGACAASYGLQAMDNLGHGPSFHVSLVNPGSWETFSPDVLVSSQWSTDWQGPKG